MRSQGVALGWYVAPLRGLLRRVDQSSASALIIIPASGVRSAQRTLRALRLTVGSAVRTSDLAVNAVAGITTKANASTMPRGRWMRRRRSSRLPRGAVPRALSTLRDTDFS